MSIANEDGETEKLIMLRVENVHGAGIYHSSPLDSLAESPQPNGLVYS